MKCLRNQNKKHNGLCFNRHKDEILMQVIPWWQFIYWFLSLSNTQKVRFYEILKANIIWKFITFVTCVCIITMAIWKMFDAFPCWFFFIKTSASKNIVNSPNKLQIKLFNILPLFLGSLIIGIFLSDICKENNNNPKNILSKIY